MELTDRQRRAALDHAKSTCVTAGAGTGKTHVLVQKYIDLLASHPDLGVGNILALTFTEKAAAGMKVRIRAALAAKEGERWETLRDEFLWAQISTFHAFCARVLREFPLEAGVVPGFAVLDEREASRLRDEAFASLVSGNPPEPCRTALVGVLRAVGTHGLKTALDRLYSRRDTAERFFAALAESEETVLAAWQAAVERFREEEQDAFSAAAAPALETLRDLAARCSGDADPGQEYLTAAGPHLAAGSVAALAEIHSDRRFTARMGRKANWTDDDLAALRTAYKDLDTCIKAHAGCLSLAVDPDDPFTRATLAHLRDLAVAFRAFTDAVDAEKRRRRALDFTDLISRTHRLFTECDHLVQAHFRSRFRYILVDEFQDTDPVQSGIISAILGDLAHLFVVGDPKQSIYLFRDADVTQFARTRDLIERDLGGEAVPLDVNFRSTPAVVGFVNAVFSVLMATSDRPWEFPYEPLRASRSSDTGSVELLLTPKGETPAATRRAEAEMVARKIQNLVEHERRSVHWDRNGKHLDEPRPAAYGDVAILLERRTNLAAYEWALARYGVPYHVHAGLGFYARQEVYDLYNILRFLASDSDDVALYGLLRSPYFGFSDAVLFSVAEAGSPDSSLWERLQRFAADRPDAAAAVRRLASWLLSARRVPPADLLRRIVAESEISLVFGGMPGGEQAAANVEKVTAILREMEQSGRGTLDEVVAELGQCIDDGEREGDAPLDLASADAVRVMTVHAAKGLEFPIVVVPDLAEPPRAGGGPVMLEEGLLLGVTVQNPANDYEPEETPILTVLKREYRRKEDAEQKRLFYVAATRAKDHLVLSGTLPETVPAALDGERTRMAWLAHCLRLSGEAYSRGAAELAVPGEAEPLVIPLVTDPAAIHAEPCRRDAVSPALPDGGSPAPDVPVTVEEEEHAFSASEIRQHLRGQPERTAKARGPDDALTRGLIVHEVLRGRDPAAVLRRYGATGRADELRAIADRFRAAPLMRGATSDHCEVPFRVRIGGVLFAGAVDRLVRRPDGSWALIDYKTGGADDYAVQMTIYRRAAEEILGRPVTPYLYFVDDDRWVEVAADEEKILATVLDAAREINEQRRRA